MEQSDLIVLLSIVSFVSSLACNVGLLFVVHSVVRRHRPDAYRPLLAWAILGVASPILGRALSVAFVPIAIALGLSVNASYNAGAFTVLVFVPIDVATAVLLARGLIRVAQPAKLPANESDAPYR